MYVRAIYTLSFLAMLPFLCIQNLRIRNKKHWFQTPVFKLPEIFVSF